jgi:polygalacturonase
MSSCGTSRARIHRHGISIGSVSHGTVTNVTVEDIRFYNSRNGLRIKTFPNFSGLVSGITFRNIQLTRVRNPMVITGNYCPHPPCPPGSVAVLVRGITFEDIRGTGSSPKGVVGHFDCSEISPCTGITLRRVQLQRVGGGEASFRCEHASGAVAQNATPKSCAGL